MFSFKLDSAADYYDQLTSLISFVLHRLYHNWLRERDISQGITIHTQLVLHSSGNFCFYRINTQRKNSNNLIEP